MELDSSTSHVPEVASPGGIPQFYARKVLKDRAAVVSKDIQMEVKVTASDVRRGPFTKI